MMRMGGGRFINLDKLTSYQNLIIVASILPIIIFGFVSYYNAEEDKIDATREYISNANAQKKQIVLDYFKQVEFDTNNLAQTIKFFQKQTSSNIKNLQEIQKRHLQDFYKNSEKELLSLSKKDIFQYIFDFKNRAKEVNPEYIKNLHTYEKDLNIKNVLMINKNGKIIYSSTKDTLLNTHITQLTQPFKEIWHEVKFLKYKGANSIRFVQTGYNKYTQSYKQYAISPFQDVDGFVAIEIDLKHVQKDIQNVKSLGKTAETYLIYKEHGETFLATDRHVKIGKVGDKKSGKYIDLGFTSSSTNIKVGSSGTIEIVGYTPINIKNIHFSMQTTVSYIETISPLIKGANFFEQFTQDYDYHNILLIHKNGKIFYSVEKEDDEKTNILTGKYSKTFLAKAVKKVFKSKKFLLTDIDFYPACPDKIAQFAIIPILDANSSVQTILAVQLRLHELTRKLAIANTLYKTNETYLVGADYKLRTDTTLKTSEYNIFNSFVKEVLITTLPVKLALSGKIATRIEKDYRGVSVLSSFNKIQYSDVDWAILTEIDEAEITQSLQSLKSNIYLFVFIASFIIFFVMLLIINDKKRNDKKLEYRAKHDSLTELPNRNYILEYLTYLLANNKRSKHKGAILFIDLDKFKVINDTHGHKAGDFVLKEVASLLGSSLRGDDVLARLGGDEFLVIMNNFDKPNDIDVLCKRIIKRFDAPILDDKRSYEIGVSIGISIFPYDSTDASELLAFADTAMYKTKENGRNGYTFYDKGMRERSLYVARIEKELKHAINNDELTLHYQPQVNLQTLKVSSTEALVRWRHPKDGFIMPNDFIPIAENSNLIIDLGYWVLERACKDFLQWKELGYEMEYVAVNMSSKQLQAPECVQSVISILEKLSFNPQWIELEITETTLISNFESTLNNMNDFKKMGIKFSIDDFGTGYSSLSYLKTLDISTLKIDREFVKDIIEDKDDRTIVSAIIAMGHALNYTIVAEGAETKAEVELLKHLSCDIVQGYYFSKPLSAKKLLEFIDAH